jgi:hypothetical protein
MTSETENKPPIPSKEEVIETLIDIFISVASCAIERKNVFWSSDITKDFDICDDDIPAFIVLTHKKFNIKKYRPEWDKVEPTIEAIADLVLDCLNRPEPPPIKGILARFLYWLRL